MIIVMRIVIINYNHDNHDDHDVDPGDDHDFDVDDPGAVSWRTRVVARTHLRPYK